jgi:hypothetical protein
MATEVTISLPDEVYQRAERFALLANRDLGIVLADTVGASLFSIQPHLDRLTPIEMGLILKFLPEATSKWSQIRTRGSRNYWKNSGNDRSRPMSRRNLKD